jgi:hypothetical protein
VAIRQIETVKHRLWLANFPFQQAMMQGLDIPADGTGTAPVSSRTWNP